MTPHIQELQDRFEIALKAYIEGLPGDSLHAPMKYILSLGGKRIRPVLVMLAGEVYSAPLDHTTSAALAIELFHNFSLVHDDIMDEAPLRRGKTTVHEKWNANTAILAGDAMLIEAYKQLAKAAPEHLNELLELFNNTSIEVCQGQQLDMDFETSSEVTAEEYVEMISLKTAVLLGCSLKMGAILAGSTAEDAVKLYTFGKLSGIGFQIQDDYLDAFGDPSRFGKQVGGDIISNKKTFLIIRAMEKADPETRRQLESIYFSHDGIAQDGKVEKVLSIFRNLGIDRDTMAESVRYFEAARIALEELSVSSEKKKPLLDFLESLQEREY
jgi:geranylgeranyl diphosphate synthase type II